MNGRIECAGMGTIGSRTSSWWMCVAGVNAENTADNATAAAAAVATNWPAVYQIEVVKMHDKWKITGSFISEHFILESEFKGVWFRLLARGAVSPHTQLDCKLKAAAVAKRTGWWAMWPNVGQTDFDVVNIRCAGRQKISLLQQSCSRSSDKFPPTHLFVLRFSLANLSYCRAAWFVWTRSENTRFIRSH